MTTEITRQPTKILVLNPNSSATMTHGVEEAIKGMDLFPVSLIDDGNVLCFIL